MKVYQGGPMRGYPQYNYNTFEQGKVYLKWLGHEVRTPHDFDIANGFVKFQSVWDEDREHDVWFRDFYEVRLTDKFTVESAMRLDIAAILESDAVSFLPGWEYSSGARNEYAVAKMLGLPIYEHQPWTYFYEAPLTKLEVVLMPDVTVSV